MIKLNNGYFIEIDSLNYTLKQNYIGEDKKGQKKKYERTIGYFGNIRQLMERYLEQCQKEFIGQSDIDFEEYVKMVEQSNEMAVKGLESVLEQFPIK